MKTVFKAGQRVRMIEDFNSLSAGEVYTIKDVDHDCGDRPVVVRKGVYQEFVHVGKFELINQPEAEKQIRELNACPVGDRRYQRGINVLVWKGPHKGKVATIIDVDTRDNEIGVGRPIQVALRDSGEIQWLCNDAFSFITYADATWFQKSTKKKQEKSWTL